MAAYESSFTGQEIDNILRICYNNLPLIERLTELENEIKTLKTIVEQLSNPES